MNFRHAMIFWVIGSIAPSLWGQDLPSEQFVKAALDRIAHLERRISMLEQTIPEPASAPAPGPTLPVSGLPETQGTHVVQEGETLIGIARRRQVSVPELEKVNRLLPGAVIRAGDRLVIPGDAPAAPPSPLPSPSPQTDPGHASAAVAPPPSADASSWSGKHVIREGETLSAIARTHGTNAAELARRNGIQDANLIRAGQALSVPGPQGSTVAASAPPASSDPSAVPQPEETYHYYDVVEGDTILSVATTFYTTPEEVARLNNISMTEILQLGQQLVVPTRRYFEEKKRQNGMS